MRSDRKWTHLSKLPAASNPWNSFIAPIEAGICWNLPLAITGTGKYQYGILDLLTVRCLEKSTWKTTIAHRTVAWLMVMNYHGWIRRKNNLKKTNASCVKYRLKHPRLPILKGHQKGVITPFTMVQSVKKHLTNPRIAVETFPYSKSKDETFCCLISRIHRSPTQIWDFGVWNYPKFN